MAKMTFLQKLGYIFAPADSKGVGFFDRLVLIGALGADDAWRARADQPAEKFLSDTVAKLSAKMGISPPPQIIVYKSDVPNAASIVSGNIVIGSNILEIMTPGQIEAVMGHELSHHRHRGRDMPILLGIPLAYDVISEVLRAQMWRSSSPTSKIAVATAHTVGLYGANVVLPMGYMRQLEFEADKEGAWFTGRPQDMRGALEALERRGSQLQEERKKANPTLQPKRPPRWYELSHPPTPQRLERLNRLEAQMKRDGQLPEETLPSGPVSR